MYCPTHPEAIDLSAVAARKQGLEEVLYPLKMVYDDGMERIAFDSARDRASWSRNMWGVLERLHAAIARASSAVSSRSGSGTGSGSTRYNKGGSPPLQHQTTDDAVIATAGGLTAPLTSRDSRRLAGGTVQRAQSLRRVASDMDLRDRAAAAPTPPLLTPEVARQRTGSRDFVFARGIAPPPLSPSPSLVPSFATAQSRSPASPRRSQHSGSSTPVASRPASSHSHGRYATLDPPSSVIASEVSSRDGQSFHTASGAATPRSAPSTRSYADVASRPPSSNSRTRTRPPSPVPPSEMSSSSAASAVTAPVTVPLPSEASTPRTQFSLRAALYAVEPSAPPSPRSSVSNPVAPLDSLPPSAPSSTIGSSTAREAGQTGWSGPTVIPRSSPSAPSAPGSVAGAGSASASGAGSDSGTGGRRPGSRSRARSRAAPSSDMSGSSTEESLSVPSERSPLSGMSPSVSPETRRYVLYDRPMDQIPDLERSNTFASHAGSENERNTASASGSVGGDLASAFGTAQPGSSYGNAQLGSTYGTAIPGSIYESAAAPPSTAPPGSAYISAAPGSSYGTAPPGSTYGTAVQASTYGTAAPTSNYASALAPSSFGTAQPVLEFATVPSASEYTSAMEPPPRPPSKGSESSWASAAMDARSLQTAPLSMLRDIKTEPAVTKAMIVKMALTEAQSNYATASPASSTSYATASPAQSSAATNYGSAKQPSSYGTPATSSTGTSYNTAPPASSSIMTRATTPVSEPDVDFAALSELERLSSVGSSASFRPPRPHSMYGTAREMSSYASASSNAYTAATEGRTNEQYGTASSMPSLVTAQPPSTQPSTTGAPMSTWASTVPETVGSPPMSMRPLPPSTWAPTIPESLSSPPLPMHPPPPSTWAPTVPESLGSPPMSMRALPLSTTVVQPPPPSTWAPTMPESVTSPPPSMRQPPASTVAPTIPETLGPVPASMHAPPPSTAEPTVVETLGPAPASMRAPPPSTVYNPAPESVGSVPASFHQRAPHSISTAQSLAGSTAPPTLTSSLPAVQSISTAQSTAGSAPRIPRKPVPSHPPSDPTASSAPTSTASSSTTSVAPAAPDYNMLRLINYLQGQEQVRQGQTTRIGDQLDRIETKIGKLERLDKLDDLEAKLSTLHNLPPPVPSKDGHGDPDGSDSDSESDTSSVSSTETARPVTPAPVIIPAAFSQRLDDISTLLGAVLGQQRDIMDELGRRREIQVELDSNRHITLPRIEDLLRNILERVEEGAHGQSYASRRTPSVPYKRRATPVHEADSDVGDREGPWYNGAGSVVSSDGGLQPPAPPNSEAGIKTPRTVYLTESLLDENVGEPDFDDEFMINNLPPAEPPQEQRIPRAQPPTFIRRLPPMGQPQQPMQAPQPAGPQQPQERAYDYTSEVEAQPETEIQHPRPIPFGAQHAAENLDQYADADAEQAARGPLNRGPTPQPIDWPTPVAERDRRLQTPAPPPGPIPSGLPPASGPPGPGPQFTPGPGLTPGPGGRYVPPPASGPGLSSRLRPSRRGPPMTRS